MLEPPSLESCKGLTVKFQVIKISNFIYFPNSYSGVYFFRYKLSEGLEISKMLAPGIRIQKNPQTRAYILYGYKSYVILK